MADFLEKSNFLWFDITEIWRLLKKISTSWVKFADYLKEICCQIHQKTYPNDTGGLVVGLNDENLKKTLNEAQSPSV